MPLNACQTRLFLRRKDSLAIKPVKVELRTTADVSLRSYPILRNFSFLATAHVISALTGIVTVAIVARALGPEAYGILGFSIAILAYLGLATNLGTDTHGVRQIAQDESSLGATAGIALTQRTIMAVFCLLSLICTLAIMRPGPEITAVLLIQSMGCLLYTSPSPRDRG